MTIGGDQHNGWMPTGATRPVPDPVRAVSLDIRIARDPGGYLLIYTSQVGAVHGDTWHETLQGAESAAFEWFGLGASEWETRTDDVAG